MPAGDLVLMGAPGSGKGTQARLLADRHGWVQLATGDLFRDHGRRGTTLGKLADGYMTKGQYVPDEVTVAMVRERLGEITVGTRVVFDGFPRTVAQAISLDGLLGERGRAVGAVVLIEVGRDELLVRLGGRATCSDCQAVYSLAARPPARAGRCDRCGGPVVATARPDDSPEVVRKRLALYEEQTRSVVEHYAGRGLLRPIDGVGAIEEVADRVAVALR